MTLRMTVLTAMVMWILLLKMDFSRCMIGKKHQLEICANCLYINKPFSENSVIIHKLFPYLLSLFSVFLHLLPLSVCSRSWGRCLVLCLFLWLCPVLRSLLLSLSPSLFSRLSSLTLYLQFLSHVMMCHRAMK